MLGSKTACAGSLATLVVAAILLASATARAAQGLSCTAFLHARDGSWRSLEDGPVFGPNGTVSIATGEILRPTDPGDKGEIARALNDLCESQ